MRFLDYLGGGGGFGLDLVALRGVGWDIAFWEVLDILEIKKASSATCLVGSHPALSSDRCQIQVY